MVKRYLKILASIMLLIIILVLLIGPITISALLVIEHDQSPYWWFLNIIYLFELPAWKIAIDDMVEQQVKELYK